MALYNYENKPNSYYHLLWLKFKLLLPLIFVPFMLHTDTSALNHLSHFGLIYSKWIHVYVKICWKCARNLSEASQNLQLEGFGGVDVSVGCVQDPAPFIHVGQTGNFPRYPSLAASRRLVITCVWFVMGLNFSASFTVLHLG